LGDDWVWARDFFKRQDAKVADRSAARGVVGLGRFDGHLGVLDVEIYRAGLARTVAR
jgi:hypothetical protein